jgi:hypothetical protein
MSSREVSGLLGLTIALAVLVLSIFGILQLLHVPSGNFLDWLIGTASFWWLLVIVTVPWNIHFGAKAVLVDAAESHKQGIDVDESQMRYVQQLAQRSLGVAIALHLLSAIGLYALAATGISPIGYISSAAALLFTILRPAIALYQYLADRLQAIGQMVRYPREDVMEVRDRLSQVESNLLQLEYQFNLENSDSQAAASQRIAMALRQDLTQLAAAHEDLKATNQADHERLSREARTAIAQLSTDGQVLDHVRELIRFFKSA